MAIDGSPSIHLRSLRDRQQFFDPHGAAARAGFSSAAWPLFGLLWPSARPLAAHHAGADVTASDSHPLAGRFLRANLRLNHLAALPYRHGPWAADARPSTDETALTGSFQLLFGSDVLYERDDEGCLAAFIGRHAAPVAEVWIVDPHRGNRPPFTRRMAKLGFSLAEERIDDGDFRGRWLIYRRV